MSSAVVLCDIALPDTTAVFSCLIFENKQQAYICRREYGFGYIKALAQGFYQINDVRMIKAVGLDIEGADCEEILRTAEKTISKDTLH